MITTISQNPKYYRWIILFFCFITITLTNGLTLGGLVVFEEEIIKSLSAITGQEVLRADLKLRDALTLWSTALFGFFSGLLADESTKIKIFRLSHWVRYGTLQTITTPSVGVKKLMISGFVLLSGCFYFYAQAESLFGMYILHALMGVVLCISGMIVNVISDMSYRTVPGRLAYSASKAALKSFSECIRQELRPYGVDGISIFPFSFG